MTLTHDDDADRAAGIGPRRREATVGLAALSPPSLAPFKSFRLAIKFLFLGIISVISSTLLISMFYKTTTVTETPYGMSGYVGEGELSRRIGVSVKPVVTIFLFGYREPHRHGFMQISDDIIPWWGKSFYLNERRDSVIVAYGWPARSFMCMHTANVFQWDETVYGIRTKIMLPQQMVWPPIPRSIPLLPIWRGLILNWVIYSACWWLVWLVWKRGMSVYRTRMGRCRCCGYDLRGSKSSGCPECGWNRPAGEGEPPPPVPVSPESNEART